MTTKFTRDSHLYLIDGSAFIFRAFHALPALTRHSDGLPIGAVSGFCNMIFKMVQGLTGEKRPSHLAVIFDATRTTFRHDIYAGYKANRSDPPEDLVPQFALIRQATHAFGLPCIEKEGFEADDIIATYARQAQEAGGDVTIVSSDKDLMQLVSANVTMLDPIKNKRLGTEDVVDKFGVTPDKVIDIQALAGDSIDNVPGAPGIGVKTAALLINEFGDLDTLLTQAADIPQKKRRETLLTYGDQIRLSRQLVTLEQHVEDLEPLENFELINTEAKPLLAFLSEMGLRQLLQKVARALDCTLPAQTANTPLRNNTTPAIKKTGFHSPQLPRQKIDRSKYEIIQTQEDLDRWITRICDVGTVAIDTETTSLDVMQAELVGISLAVAPNEACYIPVGHTTNGDNDLFSEVKIVEGQLDRQLVLDALGPLLKDQSILKIGQNIKYDLSILACHGISSVSPIDDTMLMSYVLSSGLSQHNMDALSADILGHTTLSIKDLIGSGKKQITFDKVDIVDAAPYAAEDADITLRLAQILKPRLVEQQLSRVYETLERPLVPVLATMEREGIKVDPAQLSKLSSLFAAKMLVLEEEIYASAGEQFNIGSPKQLGEILFDKMGIYGGKKSKTGAYTTGADILEQLSIQGHNIARQVLDWRQMSKLKSTYTDALQKQINEKTGRVHTSFSLAATTTGRLSSSEPNVQNIPIRTEEGRKIREAFIVDKGNTLLSLDYSQIELRILAHIANIPALTQAFKDGIDIHAMTAAEVFNIPLKGMDPMIRRQAKAINFGVIYGISAFGLSNQLGISQGEAKKFIDAYFAKFPGIQDYMRETKNFAKEFGYVETLFGRRIHTPQIHLKGPQAAFAARAAINAPIQGTAADIIRRAMIRIPSALAKEGLETRMLLQVHDELLFEAPVEEAEKVTIILKDIMQHASLPVLQLSVPLVVEAGQGNSWAKAQ